MKKYILKGIEGWAAGCYWAGDCWSEQRSDAREYATPELAQREQEYLRPTGSRSWVHGYPTRIIEIEVEENTSTSVRRT